MNKVYETIKEHKSVRKYKETAIPQEDLHKILEAALAAPTSINGQQCSVIVIKDAKKKAQIAEWTGGQEWVAKAPVFLVFVADFARAAMAMEARGVKMEITESVESTLVGAVDCGIAFGSMMTLAESMGYGMVPIGAIRRNPQGIIDLLKLPKYTYPIVGMCLGLPDEEIEVKERFSFDTIIHEEEYKPLAAEELARYDAYVKDYMIKRMGDERNWSDVMANFYSYIYFPEVKGTMEEQGFTNKK